MSFITTLGNKITILYGIFEFLKHFPLLGQKLNFLFLIFISEFFSITNTIYKQNQQLHFLLFFRIMQKLQSQYFQGRLKIYKNIHEDQYFSKFYITMTKPKVQTTHCLPSEGDRDM